MASTESTNETTVDVTQGFYRALAARDVAALTALLDDDVQAAFSAGLPPPWGGLHRGRDATLRTWADMAASIDVIARPEEVVRDGDRRIVLGEYVGSFLADGRAFRADFVHVLRIRAGRIVEIRQVTDTAAWTSSDRGSPRG